MRVHFFRTRVAHRLLTSISIALMLCLLGGGCSKPPPTPTPPPPPPSNGTAVGVTDAEAATSVVINYLRAIYAEEYQTAYALLSEKSKELHTPEVFAAEAKKAYVLYDLEEARAKSQAEGKVEVVMGLQQEEEPGAKAFSVVKEDGEWKIVYYKGKPLFPYAE